MYRDGTKPSYILEYAARRRAEFVLLNSMSEI